MPGQATNPMSDPKSYLTKEQIRLLIDGCERSRDRLLLKFLSRTGRRISEVVRRLKVSDIDFEKGLVNFTILKRKVPTTSLLPIDRALLEELKEYTKNMKQDQIIWHISRQRVDQILKTVSKNIGLEHIGTGKHNKVHAHLFRHSFAIHGAKALTNPADLVQLKNMLCHARIDTTMFYLRFNPMEQRKLLEEMWGE